MAKEVKVAMAYPAFYSYFKKLIPQLEPKITPDDVKEFDLIIFSGGEDVDPSLYGEENVSSWSNPDRDKIEKAIFDVAFDLNKKMLGVCRGHQLLNVLMGHGTLFQDLSQAPGGPHKGNHPLQYEKAHDILKVLPQYVNSLHHQGIKSIGSCMSQVATWNHLPEVCISKSGTGNVLTFQFHPELMSDETKPLFRWILNSWKVEDKLISCRPDAVMVPQRETRRFHVSPLSWEEIAGIREQTRYAVSIQEDPQEEPQEEERAVFGSISDTDAGDTSDENSL